jgi:hypothetical protein
VISSKVPSLDFVICHIGQALTHRDVDGVCGEPEIGKGEMRIFILGEISAIYDENDEIDEIDVIDVIDVIDSHDEKMP